MSLAEQVTRWRAKVEDQVAAHGEDWVVDALDRAEVEATKHLGSATGDLVAQALDELRPAAPAIARRGAAAFRGALSEVWSTDVATARKAWAELALLTPEQRRARLRDQVVRADDAVTQAEKDMAELMDGLERAGKTALQLAVPLLLALL